MRRDRYRIMKTCLWAGLNRVEIEVDGEKLKKRSRGERRRLSRRLISDWDSYRRVSWSIQQPSRNVTGESSWHVVVSQEFSQFLDEAEKCSYRTRFTTLEIVCWSWIRIRTEPTKSRRLCRRLQILRCPTFDQLPCFPLPPSPLLHTHSGWVFHDQQKISKQHVNPLHSILKSQTRFSIKAGEMLKRKRGSPSFYLKR